MGLRISENKAADIQQAADILDVVSETVALKKAGKDYVGLCPFHSEKTPSFTVSTVKQMFYCFGCGAGGDVVAFVRKQYGLSYPETLKMLADRYGIELPDTPVSPEEDRRNREREALYAVNRRAMAYFHEMLERPENGRGLDYLNKRGMTGLMRKDFQLGFAPDAWNLLQDHLERERVDPKLLEKAGLIIPRKNGNGFYDRFRNRIIFPIINTRMQVVGFGGRVMDNTLPKYLNSPETPVYQKGRSLYGLHKTVRYIRESGTVFIVEGYFDCLALYRSGIQNVAATLGTAMTPDHLKLLKTYAKSAVLVFDSDQAGVKAAQRSISLFNKEQMDVRILILPEGHDPDTYLDAFGPDSFKRAADNAMSTVSFLLDLSVKRNGLSIEGKSRIVADMKEPVLSIRDQIAKSLYIKELSERLGVDESIVRAQYGESGEKVVHRPAYEIRKPVQPAGRSINGREGSGIEKKVISMMLQFPEIIEDVGSRGIMNYFSAPNLKSIGETIIKLWRQNGFCLPDLLNALDNEKKQSVTACLNMGEDTWNREGCLRLLDQFESATMSRLFKKKKIAVKDDQDLLLEASNRILMQARERQSII